MPVCILTAHPLTVPRGDSACNFINQQLRTLKFQTRRAPCVVCSVNCSNAKILQFLQSCLGHPLGLRPILQIEVLKKINNKEGGLCPLRRFSLSPRVP